MNPHLIRNQKDEALYTQASSRIDYDYNHSDVVTARTAYKDYSQKANMSLILGHIAGVVVACVTKQKIRNFFLTSFTTFSTLNYINDSNSRKIIEKSAQNNIERLNVMMDLK